MLAIDIQNLKKSYQKGSSIKEALKGVTLQIPQGEIFGLLGPNGAGKSTIINILSGMVLKTSGTVKIMGHDIDVQHKVAKAKIGIVPQEIVIDNFFPLAQTLEFTAGYYGIRKKDLKIEELLHVLGLYEQRNLMPRQLSGGMKRRFLVAKAMIHSPEVLILDEPTAGVDIKLRDQLWDYVQFLHSSGITIIITTHYLQEAQNLCKKIAFINHGKIIHQDYTENLLKDFGTRYVKVTFHESVNQEVLEKIGFRYSLLGSDTVSFDTTAQDYDYNKLVASLATLNFAIKDIQVNQMDLETVFKKIISSNTSC